MIPPTGGFGGNTGIHDAHNLAWKLDAVLRGVAGPALLDTYESERKPAAEQTLALAMARLQAWFKDPSKKLSPAEKIIDDHRVIFGYVYKKGALISDQGPAIQEAFENPRTPSGHPGSRAPHVFLERTGKRISTLDLFNGEWVLLAGSKGAAWIQAATTSAVAKEFGFKCHLITSDGDLRDFDGKWESAYGVKESGAVLIRPDGFIAWRVREQASDPESVLDDVLQRISFKDVIPAATNAPAT